MERHVQLPNRMTEGCQLNPKDLLVYLAIKRHYNSETGQCNPGYRLLGEETSASVNTVKKCINNLLESGYLTKVPCGRGFNYAFTDYKTFEPFSYEFLDNKDYTFQEKAYLASIQQYMYINGQDFGCITIPNHELSEKLNISHDTISRLDRSLQKKQALAIIDTRAVESETNCTIKEKVFALKAYGQAIAYTLRNHEDRITENSEKINELEKKLEESNKDRKLMYRELCKMKDQLNELQNKEIIL